MTLMTVPTPSVALPLLQQLLGVTWLERFTLSANWPLIIDWLLGGLLILHFAAIAGAPLIAEAFAKLGGPRSSSKQTVTPPPPPPPLPPLL